VIVKTPNEAAMEDFGAQIAAVSPPGVILFLTGELGAGKTTLARGFLRGLGYLGPVKSPTYTLVEPYELGAARVYHLDLYRLSDPEELEFMGIRDYFDDVSTCLIEWPERAACQLPAPDLRLEILYSKSGRRVVMTGVTLTGRHVMERLGVQQRQ
jgi:tRNA threonylcarbamoyladenosine biosynthesis protein TsaE